MLPDPEQPERQLTLPMSLDGIISYVPVSTPSQAEWDSGIIPRIDLTSRDLTWDPSTKSYESQEDAVYERLKRERISNNLPAPGYRISSMSSMGNDAVDVTDDDNFADILESNVIASISSVHSNSGIIRSKSQPAIDHLKLSEHWNISPERARMTVNRTTQKGVQTCLHPLLNRR